MGGDSGAPSHVADYPELRESHLLESEQGAECSVQGSDVSLIMGPDKKPDDSEVLPGPALTQNLASFLSRPVKTVRKEDAPRPSSGCGTRNLPLCECRWVATQRVARASGASLRIVRECWVQVRQSAG